MSKGGKETRTAEDRAKKERKQQRARARRLANQKEAAIRQLYKPLAEWDEEELAKGRPKSADGTFVGRPPAWISREIHEEAVKRFQDHAQAEMRGLVPKALDAIQSIILDEGVDEKGRPLVPASVRLDAAKWTVEHFLGKPTQRIEADISVKLQGILAQALVQPDGQLAIEGQSWEVLDEEDDSDLGMGGEDG